MRHDSIEVATDATNDDRSSPTAKTVATAASWSRTCENMTFSVNRKVFVSPDVLEGENRAIFDKCWIYVGHASEIKQPGRLPHPLRRRPAGDLLPRPAGHACARCSTSAATAAPWSAASARATRGSSTASITAGPTTPTARSRAFRATTPIRRASTSRARAWCRCRGSSTTGFLFRQSRSATRSISRPISPAPRTTSTSSSTSRRPGRMEIISGTQEYDIKANWKLLVENSVDDYHLVTTHSTWLNYMRNSGVNVTPAKGHMLPTKGFGKDLGNGHLTTDNPNYRGRPVARWISVYGEEAKADIDAIRKELVERLGEARAARVADTNRNLCIFPNLVINDGSSVTVRNFYPVGARPDAGHRLGARPGRGDRGAARAPAARLPHLLRPRRLRHARRRRGAGTGAAGLRRLARGAVDRSVARHGQRARSSLPPTRAICACSGASGAS